MHASSAPKCLRACLLLVSTTTSASGTLFDNPTRTCRCLEGRQQHCGRCPAIHSIPPTNYKGALLSKQHITRQGTSPLRSPARGINTAAMNDDATAQEIQRKIDRERSIINAANQMRQATNNASVTSRAESQIREARRNIQYFEQTLNDLRSRKMGNDMSNLSVSGNGGPTPPQHGRGGSSGSGYRKEQGHGGGADYGDPGPGGYSMGGAPGLMPPRAPYAPPGPADRSPRARPNYSKLGGCSCSAATLTMLILRQI